MLAASLALAIALAGGAAVALVPTGEDSSSPGEQLTVTAEELAQALSAGSVASLVQLSCSSPTDAQRSGLDSALAGRAASFSVAEAPRMPDEGMRATVMLHMEPAGNRAEEQQLPYTLTWQGSRWCAEIPWGQFGE